MSWFKVDDRLAFNTKVVAAGNAAMGLWVRAGSWCASQGKGGFVPLIMANAMRMPCDSECDGQCDYGCDIDALLQVGLWHDVPGGFAFHDWTDYQPSAEEEAAKRQKRSDAGKRGAEARWGDGNSHANANGNANGKTMARRNAPDPTRPDHKNTPADADFAAFWAAYPKRVAKEAARKAWAKAAKTTTPSVLIEAATTYATTTEGTDPKFIKHPATWLNGGCWEDETEAPETPARSQVYERDMRPFEGDPDDVEAWSEHRRAERERIWRERGEIA